MDKPIFKLVTLPEANDFLESLAPAVLRKMFYNIDKIAGGVKDSDLFKFKKTRRYRYLGIPHILAGHGIPSICFLG